MNDRILKKLKCHCKHFSWFKHVTGHNGTALQTMIGLFHGLWFTISSDNHNIYMNHNPGHNMMWQKWQLFKSRTASLY